MNNTAITVLSENEIQINEMVVDTKKDLTFAIFDLVQAQVDFKLPENRVKNDIYRLIKYSSTLEDGLEILKSSGMLN